MFFWNIYAAILLITIPIDEAWNLNNPMFVPYNDYILCNWEQDDFYPIQVESQWLLREYKEGDSAI